MSEQDGVQVHVLVVTATPGRRDDGTQQAIAAALATGGHTIADVADVAADIEQIQQAVRTIAANDAQALLVVGGTTPFEGLVTPHALEPLLSPRFAGFNNVFQPLWHARAGSQAVWVDIAAGLVGRTAVFALPPSDEAIDLALRELIAPQLTAAVGVGVLHGGGVPAPAPAATVSYDLGPDPVTQEAVFEDVAGEPVDEEEAPAVRGEEEPPPLPPPSGSLGRLGRGGLSFAVNSTQSEEPPPPSDDPALARTGWLRAVRELEGTVHLDKREDLPQPVEKLAPFLDVLHNAGETGVLKLPSGVTYSVWGYPDLRRASSKVLAVGWGRPLVELIALHRYPVQTGTCLEQAHGLLPNATADLAETAEAITGTPPRNTDGSLFAVEGDAVWIARGRSIVRWDGRKESDMGSAKQALATLALAWSAR